MSTAESLKITICWKCCQNQ